MRDEAAETDGQTDRQRATGEDAEYGTDEAGCVGIAIKSLLSLIDFIRRPTWLLDRTARLEPPPPLAVETSLHGGNIVTNVT